MPPPLVNAAMLFQQLRFCLEQSCRVTAASSSVGRGVARGGSQGTGRGAPRGGNRKMRYSSRLAKLNTNYDTAITVSDPVSDNILH